jgi:hypothetical protein
LPADFSCASVPLFLRFHSLLSAPFAGEEKPGPTKKRLHLCGNFAAGHIEKDVTRLTAMLHHGRNLLPGLMSHRVRYFTPSIQPAHPVALAPHRSPRAAALYDEIVIIVYSMQGSPYGLHVVFV